MYVSMCVSFAVYQCLHFFLFYIFAFFLFLWFFLYFFLCTYSMRFLVLHAFSICHWPIASHSLSHLHSHSQTPSLSPPTTVHSTHSFSLCVRFFTLALGFSFLFNSFFLIFCCFLAFNTVECLAQMFGRNR